MLEWWALPLLAFGSAAWGWWLRGHATPQPPPPVFRAVESAGSWRLVLAAPSAEELAKLLALHDCWRQLKPGEAFDPDGTSRLLVVKPEEPK